MSSIFDPTLVVWAGLTVPPALLALTAWIGYRRSSARAAAPLSQRRPGRPRQTEGLTAQHAV